MMFNARIKRHLTWLITGSIVSFCVMFINYRSGRVVSPSADMSRKIESIGFSSTTQTHSSSQEGLQTRKTKVVFGNDSCTYEILKPTTNGISYRKIFWQVQNESDSKGELVLYSAFYDDRNIVGYLPWIRILGVRRILPNIEPNDLYCQVWYPGEEVPHVVKVHSVVTGSDSYYNKNGRNYGQRLFSCQLAMHHPSPEFVSVVDGVCNNSTVLLPVFRPVRTARWRHEFSVCVELVFGRFPVETLVEWIEVQHLFGVTEFNIYNGSLSPNMSGAVFEYYTKKGLVNLIQMPPAVDDYSIEGVRLGSPASLNDCMMRNMYSSRFIIPIDFDELIVPRMQGTYSSMIDHIDTKLKLSESHHTYTFRMAYFCPQFPVDDTQPKYIKTLRQRHRTPPGGYLLGPKSFVDPRRCLSVFNHYCLVRFPNTGDLAIDVDSSIAMTQHYRLECSYDKRTRDEHNKTKTEDNNIMRFETEIKKRVSKALEEIKSTGS